MLFICLLNILFYLKLINHKNNNANERKIEHMFVGLIG